MLDARCDNFLFKLMFINASYILIYTTVQMFGVSRLLYIYVCVCVRACVRACARVRACVCVLYATLWGPNVPTRIVKPEIFDIVGPHEGKKY